MNQPPPVNPLPQANPQVGNIQPPGFHKSMPIPSDKKAPRFTGKDVKGFLIDYNALCTQAGYTEEQKCRNLPRYCKKRVCEFIENLDEVENPTTFEALGRVLKTYYGQTDHRKKYTRESHAKFAQRTRKIQNEAELNEYYHEFDTYASYLTKKSLLAN